MGKRKKHSQDITASLDSSDRFFARLYPGLMRSEPYKKLTIGARQFYVLCRVQACSTEGRQVLFKHGDEFDREYGVNDFVFPAAHAERFGIKRQNIARYMSELQDAGFIDIKERNNHMKRCNVYTFSTRWKNRKP